MNAPALKVLVVDDEPPIRKLLRMGLTAEGYQVIDAPNGKTALAELPQKPDVVILDLGLPDVQGLERNRFVLGLGAILHTERDLTLRFEYRGMFGSGDDTDHGVLLNLEKTY